MLLREETAAGFLRQPKYIKILLEQNSEFSVMQQAPYSVTSVC